jgi:hypothetical protein
MLHRDRYIILVLVLVSTVPFVLSTSAVIGFAATKETPP